MRWRPGTSLLLAASLLAPAGCLYSRVVFNGFPSLQSQPFDTRAVPANHAQPLARAEHEATYALTDDERARYASFDQLLETNDTRAFVAVVDDHVVYERYFGGVTADTPIPGFSISKSFAALLVGCAFDDHLLGSPRDFLRDYVPEVKDEDGYRSIRLEHLLRMTSGIDFTEESTAAALLYYSHDLRARTYSYDVKWTPGTHYLYGSVNVQILWDVLKRRLSKETVSDYFARRVWAPLGAEHAAAWALDSAEEGVEKFFGGFRATARDQVRLGLLYLHHGELEGHRVVSASWIDQSLSPDPVAGVVHTSDGAVRHGLYQWFLTLDGKAFFAKGYKGQYIFVVPSKNAVFVRFGEGYGDVDWPALFLRLAGAQ